MNILALIFVLLVSLSLVGGGILGIYLNKNKKINIELIINYLFGSMVTLIAVKLIPNITISTMAQVGNPLEILTVINIIWLTLFLLAILIPIYWYLFLFSNSYVLLS